VTFDQRHAPDAALSLSVKITTVHRVVNNVAAITTVNTGTATEGMPLVAVPVCGQHSESSLHGAIRFDVALSLKTTAIKQANGVQRYGGDCMTQRTRPIAKTTDDVADRLIRSCFQCSSIGHPPSSALPRRYLAHVDENTVLPCRTRLIWDFFFSFSAPTWHKPTQLESLSTGEKQPIENNRAQISSRQSYLITTTGLVRRTVQLLVSGGGFRWKH